MPDLFLASDCSTYVPTSPSCSHLTARLNAPSFAEATRRRVHLAALVAPVEIYIPTIAFFQLDKFEADSRPIRHHIDDCQTQSIARQ